MNVFWRPAFLHPLKQEYMEERSLLLLERAGDYDVLCLNEAFQFGSRIVHNFIQRAEAIGFKYVVSGPTVPILTRKSMDSGVLILSKYPILKTDAVVYSKGCGADSFAAKSGVYAQIAISKTRRVNVFATHLQASYHVATSADVGIRASQYTELRELIAKCTSQSPGTDPIFLLGDMNIDSIGEKKEYLDMIDNLSIPGYELVDTLKSKDHPATIAPAVEGGSEPAETYLTLKYDWGRQKSIDYIFLYLPPGLRPLYATEVQKFPVTGKPYRQLSDHVGLSCTFDFA
jgi:endonuclease/exonuclease/phosphatase family metal-dependent hydrolase